MNNDQLKSLVRSALKLIGTALVYHGATKAAAVINCEDMAGIVATIIGFVWSHTAHADVPNQPADTHTDLPTDLLIHRPLLTQQPSTPPQNEAQQTK